LAETFSCFGTLTLFQTKSMMSVKSRQTYLSSILSHTGSQGLELQRPVSQFWLALVRGAGGD
ncbi:MAG: hypothetical protein ACPH2J_09840, partial [Akkermansiaceae bacterium]